MALSAFGPVQAIESLALNQTPVTVTGGMVTSGQYANKVWSTYRNGEWTQAWTPTFGPSTIPEWTPNHRGSGIAHACLTYEYDANVFTGGAPGPVWTVQGSTSILNASTLSEGYSANCADVAYTILRGITSPSGRRIGVGLDPSYIDQAKFAAWRAVCEVNGWTCGGVWQITQDNIGDVLRAVMAAGGAEFAVNDGKASVDFFTSAASSVTIRESDLSDHPTEKPSTDRKARVSRIVPRFRSEADGWDLIPAAAVEDSTLDAQDGGRRRTETMDFPYVNSARQARQLAAYSLRVRRSPIYELPCKPHAVGIPCGARIDVDLPEYGINLTNAVVIKNEATAVDGGTVTVRADPPDLNSWALGQDGSTVSSGSMPRDPASTVQNVDTADWTASPVTITSGNTQIPIIRVTGTFPNPALARLDVQIKANGAVDWIDTTSVVTGTAFTEIRGLTPNTVYNLRARYVTIGGAASPAWVNLPNVTTGDLVAGSAAAVPWTGVTGTGKPADNATVNRITTGTSAPVSPVNGDIWVDTNAPVTIRTRVAGQWVASGNIPTALSQVNGGEGTKLAGVAVGATRNIVTTGTLAARPVGNDGDFHFATDTQLLYQKVAGSWTIAANNYNNTNQLTDGAGLGQTATWPNVTGAGKPEDNATVGARVGTNIFPNVGSTPLPGTALLNEANGIGVNQVINSDLNQGTVGHFYTGENNLTGTGLTQDAGRNLTVSGTNYFGARNALWHAIFAASGFLSSGAGTFSRSWATRGFFGGLIENNRWAMRVKPGDRVFAAAGFSVHGATDATLILRFFDRAGNIVSNDVNFQKIQNIGDARLGGPSGVNGLPSNYARVGEFFTAPPDAAYCTMGGGLANVRAGQVSVYCFSIEEQMCVVPAGQTAWPPYAPGQADMGADRTAEQQRSIAAQFPVIEIKQGEAGHTGNRTVTHTAFVSTAVLSGGTWSIVSTDLGTGSASINSVTGIVTLWGIVQSGRYTIRYTHTDGNPTDLAVNVSYIPAPATGTGGSKINRTTSTTGIASTTYSAVMSLVLTDAPSGLASVELNYAPSSWTGSLTRFQLRLTRAEVTLVESEVFTGIDGAGDIADWFTEVAAFISFYSAAAGTATWQLQARRVTGSGSISAAFGEMIVTQTAT